MTTKAVKEGRLTVVPSVYDLESGRGRVLSGAEFASVVALVL